MVKKLVLGMVLVSSSAFAWGRLEQNPYCTTVNGNTAMCAPGDAVVGGGGKCPGDPSALNRSQPIVVNGVKGWRTACLDFNGTHVPSVQTSVCCLHEECHALDEATCHQEGPVGQ